MEIKSITRYVVEVSNCHSCGGRIDWRYANKVELVDGSIIFVCGDCRDVLAKTCNIEVTTIDKPNIDECSTCWIKYRCFTNRKAEFDDEDEDEGGQHKPLSFH